MVVGTQTLEMGPKEPSRAARRAICLRAGPGYGVFRQGQHATAFAAPAPSRWRHGKIGPCLTLSLEATAAGELPGTMVPGGSDQGRSARRARVRPAHDDGTRYAQRACTWKEGEEHASHRVMGVRGDDGGALSQSPTFTFHGASARQSAVRIMGNWIPGMPLRTN